MESPGFLRSTFSLKFEATSLEFQKICGPQCLILAVYWAPNTSPNQLHQTYPIHPKSSINPRFYPNPQKKHRFCVLPQNFQTPYPIPVRTPSQIIKKFWGFDPYVEISILGSEVVIGAFVRFSSPRPQNGDFCGVEWSDRLQTVPIDSTRGYCIPVKYEGQRTTLRWILDSKSMIFGFWHPPGGFSAFFPPRVKI
jgi:hypothetical protein